ncbi:trehalose-phosphatase [Chthonobacter albigriseus]|uniref:trehalose-phosphatase n=1 Tax=Chthonobacter albigriseus TaxID=1683161 RepID=UPI0015EF279D|nr:trehalose-phosphatase [Chthonobacter albigriseus]
MYDPRSIASALPPPDRLALFLDVDGTLIGATHDDREAGLTPDQIGQLKAVQDLTGGAVAILTGRTIEAVDALFAPLQLPVAGLQGADRRFADGRRIMPVLTADERRLFEKVVEETQAGFPTVEIEWKPGGLTLVYSEGDRFVADLFHAVRARIDGAFAVVLGRVAIDIVPKDTNKGHALTAFLQSEPFAGRVPVHVGDDVPDEPAFAAARRLGGFGISVHRPAVDVAYVLPGQDDAWAMLNIYLEMHE